MGLLCSFLLFLQFLLNRSCLKSINCRSIPMSQVFVLFWTLIVFGGSLNLIGLKPVSYEVYVIVLLSAFFFSIGYLIPNISNFTINSTNKRVSEIIEFKYSLKAGLFISILFVFALYVAYKQIDLLLPIIISSGLSDARTAMQNSSLYLEGGYAILMMYFVRPFLRAVLIINTVLLFRSKISIIKSIVILLSLAAIVLSDGGRTIFVDYFFSLLYLLYIFRNRISRKVKRNMTIITLGIVILAISLTLERGSDIFSSLYVYYCGGLRYFDFSLAHPNVFYNQDLYGMCFFQGMFKPFFGILNYFGISKPDYLEMADDFLLNTQNTVVNITSKGGLNYYITCFGYAYGDGGFMAICIDMLFYGLLCFYVDKREREHPFDVRWCSIKIVLFYGALFTMACSPFATFLPPMTIIYLYVLTSGFCQKQTKKKSIVR